MCPMSYHFAHFPFHFFGDTTTKACEGPCCEGDTPLLSHPQAIVAVCEASFLLLDEIFMFQVVDDATVLKCHGGSVYTLTDPDFCCARLLLVFSQSDTAYDSHTPLMENLTEEDKRKIHSLVADFSIDI